MSGTAGRRMVGERAPRRVRASRADEGLEVDMMFQTFCRRSAGRLVHGLRPRSSGGAARAGARRTDHDQDLP